MAVKIFETNFLNNQTIFYCRGECNYDSVPLLSAGMSWMLYFYGANPRGISHYSERLFASLSVTHKMLADCLFKTAYISYCCSTPPDVSMICDCSISSVCLGVWWVVGCTINFIQKNGVMIQEWEWRNVSKGSQNNRNC